MSERQLLLIAGVLATLLLALAFLWQPAIRERPVPKPALAAGGDFTLQSAGGPVALEDFRGKVVLLYFGYTYCPDICPTSLSGIAEGLKQLAPQERDRVAVIFVSVDPARDTLPHLKEYAEFFGPEFHGLTGSAEAIADLARRYGVFYAKQKMDTTTNSYAVDHTSETYIVGPQGSLLGMLAHATPPEQIAAAIRHYLKPV